MMVLKLLQYLTIVLGVFVFTICLLMVFSKSAFITLSRMCNKSVSTRKMMKPLEINRHFDILAIFPVRAVFILFLLASIASLFLILKNFETSALVNMLSGSNIHQKPVFETIFRFIQFSLIASLVLVVLVSVRAILSPNSIQKINENMSGWLSTRQKYKFLDVSRDIDQVLNNYRAFIGITGMIVSVIMIISIALTF